MRPQSYRTRARSAAVARGRMFLKAQLHWLSGYPVAQQAGVVTWLVLPRQGEQPPTLLHLDGTTLHRATRTWRKLVYGFPRALPQIVDDYAHWVTGVPQLLDWLKPAIHDNAPMPPALLVAEGVYAAATLAHAVRLGKSYPPLQPVLNALSWICYLNPTELSAALSWLEEHVVAITVLLTQPSRPLDQLAAVDHRQVSPAFVAYNGTVTILRLWQLTRLDGAARTAALLTVLGAEDCFRLPRVQVAPFINKWIAAAEKARVFLAKVDLPAPPPATSATDLASFLLKLYQMPQGSRRRALALLAILVAEVPLAGWAAWWAMAESLLVHARHLILEAQAQNYWTYHEPYISQLDVLCEELRALLPLRPGIPPWHQQLASVAELATDDYQPFLAEVLPTLANLPQAVAGTPIQFGLLTQWAALYRSTPTAALAYLRALRHYLAQDVPLAHLLQPWLWEWNRGPEDWYYGDSSGYGGYLDRFILSEVPDRKLWPHLFAALTAACKRFPGRMSSPRAQWAIKLAQVFATPTDVLAHFVALGKVRVIDQEFDEDLLRCLLACTRPVAEWPELARALRKTQESELVVVRQIEVAAKWLQPTPWSAATAALVTNGEIAAIIKVAEQLAWLQPATATLPPLSIPSATALPPWAAHYPAAIQPALQLLVAVDPAAEQTAARLLGKAWPDPAKLQAEIAALTAQLPTHPAPTPLERRLANLRQQLIAPAPVTPDRMNNLVTKVTLSAYRIMLQRWQEAMSAQLTAQLQGWLAVDTLPAWVREPRHLSAITALLALPADIRALGLRLLRRRAGAPPWHLQDDPANQAYLQHLQRLGVDAAPWIAPAPPQLYTGPNGRQVWVGIEPDPLEVLHMGGYFRTCLRPGSFNYFSVVSNAADVNKQVVYARDEEGEVVGRCLLALTDGGQLLTFEPYCHDPTLDFGGIMAEFATDLATAMGTVVAYRGKVATLVASSWYDDGPRDLCGVFPCLAPGSLFLQALATVVPADFIATLTAGFAPLALNTLTLPLVLNLPQLRARPELVLPLLPLIGDGEGYPTALLMDVAQLAHRAGDVDFVRQMVRRHLMPYLVARITGPRRRRNYYLHHLDLVAAVDPSLTLRVLRQTRPRGVKQDEEETDWTRLSYLAQAHEALGRTVRAARLRAKIQP